MEKENKTNKEKTEVQNKVVRLFTYLEKALSLDDTIVRDFRSTITPPSPWWLADLPNDVDNLRVKSYETNQINNDDENTRCNEDVWLYVEKKNITPHPTLPSALNEWIDEIVPIEVPKAKEKIDRKIKFDQDNVRVMEFNKFRGEFTQGAKPPKILEDWIILSPNKLPEIIEERYTEEYFSYHPELQNLLNGYIENEWKPWAEKVVKIYKANLLYDQLYALRFLLKNEGDSYELLWGHVLLTWNHSVAGTIYAPIFLTPLTIDFDASKRIMELSPDPLFRGFAEISSLHDMNKPAEMDLITWVDKINSNPFNFWHFETLKTQTQFLINTLSTSSKDCFDEKLVSAPNSTETPSIFNSPVIFARKRTSDFWSKYASIIRRDIEQNNAEPTEFITDLVGDYKDTSKAQRENCDEKGKETTLADAELFFPLFWNDEQKRIAERLDAHYGVVVKGPPGTGKSHTIANLISRFLSQGKTVLVTAQTSKALEVLRDKLPENIRSLAVSQLHQTAKRDYILQQSISEISSNLGERHTKFSEKKEEIVRNDLRRVREEKASLANQIRRYILTDSSIKIDMDGEEIKPIDAAKFISKYKDDPKIKWFTDKIHFTAKLNFQEEDLRKAYAILKELTPEERRLHKSELPAIDSLPSEDTVIGTFSLYKDLSTRAEISNKIFGDSTLNYKQDKLTVLLEQLSDAKKVLISINKDYEKEIFGLCVASRNEREKWSTVLSRIREKSILIGKRRTNILGYEIVGNLDIPLNDLVDVISTLTKKTGSGTRIGTFTKLLLPLNGKKVLKSYKIDGRAPDNAERLDILYQSVLIEQAQKEIKILLNQSFSYLNSTLDLKDEKIDIVQLEVLVSSIERIVNYCNDFVAIDDFSKKTRQLSELSFTKLEDIEKLINIVSSQVAKYQMEGVETLFSDWVQLLENSINGEPHPIVEDLLDAICKLNSKAYKNSLDELRSLTDKKEKAVQLEKLSEKIKEHSPNLYDDIVSLVDQQKGFECPQNLSLVWKIARLESWLDHVHDHVDIDDLQSQLERLTKREYQLNSDLVTILAWQRLIDKVTKKQRDALMAWTLQMKKYGKGTGKYATTNLHAAQEALKEAKNAVPVWIMPLYRAAQMFSDPKAGMFDVVIFDEASQCDIRGITIGYLGKKLLVVGDPEQISPAGIFQDQERIFELISRFLFDIPFKETFSITSSFFDLAKIRLSNIIQLNEHFRCVPEIIAFSNHHIYEGKLRPLRYPHPKGLLKPALIPIYIEKGYQNVNNKVNEPEANAIIQKLIECLNDPHYQIRSDGRLCTFGIISLLAEDQAKHIEQLLRNLIAKGIIDEKTIEERRIECGDAYKFQGDERDVMFLSMVRALDPNNVRDTVAPLVDEGAKRRFNVAASRARDQMFLFHSIPLESFVNMNDWRYKILNWFYHPKKEELNAGREALKREFNSGRASQFSFDVGNILINRGYQILPEYPVIGYRIDLVVQGAEARLAVECDGDQYHTLENWDEDQVRERQLRRAGWEFWRVTGSAFYRNRDQALEPLWKKLSELGICSSFNIQQENVLEDNKISVLTQEEFGPKQMLFTNLKNIEKKETQDNRLNNALDYAKRKSMENKKEIKRIIISLLQKSTIEKDLIVDKVLKKMGITGKSKMNYTVLDSIIDLKILGIIEEYKIDKQTKIRLIVK